jgi:type II secretory pathway predicted ATPase ExeA
MSASTTDERKTGARGKLLLLSNEKQRGGQGVTPVTHGLKLKKLLHDLSITYEMLAECARIPGLLSRPSVSNLVNRNIWPRRTPRKEIEEKLEAFLRDQGASDEEIAHVWEFSDDVPLDARRDLPNGNGKAHAEIGRMGALMIDRHCMEHFGLERNPFPKRIGSKDDMLMLPPYVEVFDTVLKAIDDHEFACVVGESGSGKTTVRLMVENHLRRDPRIHFVKPLDLERERMRPNAIAIAICRELNPGIKTIPYRRETLYALAQESLTRSAEQGINVVLQIEEAHAVANESLRSLKRIMEICEGFDEALSIILWAQPEIMVSKFSAKNIELREVAERCYAIPFPGMHKYIEEYLRWKIERAGGKLENVFTADAIKAIKDRLQPTEKAPNIDTPLKVHVWASNAMMKAFQTSESRVTADVIAGLDRWWFLG